MCETKKKKTPIIWSLRLFFAASFCPTGQTCETILVIAFKNRSLLILFSSYFGLFPQTSSPSHRWKCTPAPKAHFPLSPKQRRRDDTEISLFLRESTVELDILI